MPSQEVDRLKGFATELLVFINGLSEGFANQYKGGFNPANEFLKVIPRIKTKREINSVISDLLEWTQDIKDENLTEINGMLAIKNLPTLSLMRNKKLKTFSSILSRGHIDKNEEYQLVESYMNDISNEEITSSDRELANKLLMEFEIEI